VGHLRIVDFDAAELSNLNRQILHWDEDVGRLKAESAGEKLARINPSIGIEVVSERIDESNVESWRLKRMASWTAWTTRPLSLGRPRSGNPSSTQPCTTSGPRDHRRTWSRRVSAASSPGTA
jgi:hypothetical protein